MRINELKHVKDSKQYQAHRKYSLNINSHPFFFFLKVRGYPEPQVTWHRNGQPITSGGRFLLDCGIRGSFSLVIHAVHEEDKGKYTCEATNGSGARQVTVELTVEGESLDGRALGGAVHFPKARSPCSSPVLGKEPARESTSVPELRRFKSNGENAVPVNKGGFPRGSVCHTSPRFLAAVFSCLPLTQSPSEALPSLVPGWLASPANPHLTPLWSRWSSAHPRAGPGACTCSSRLRKSSFHGLHLTPPSLPSGLCSDLSSSENPF